VSTAEAPIDRILAACRACPPGLTDLARRKHFERALGPTLAREACAQIALRDKAGTRLPGGVDWWLSTKGLAQATRWPVAIARARALDARLPRDARVWDSTCGLGIDALALAELGRLLAASDRASECARAARRHLEQRAGAAPVLVADALSEAVRAEFAFVDPDRRAGGRRTLDPASFEPSVRRVITAATKRTGLACKLPPSFDPTEIERDLPRGLARTWRWTSHGGELCETSLWAGVLSAAGGASREAECIDACGASHVHAAEPGVEAASATRAQALAAPFLCEADPTLTCSGLLGSFARAHALTPVGPRSGFLIAQGACDAPPSSPFVRSWRVLETCAADERVVRAMLRRHGIGAVDVKVRGHALGAVELARRLRRSQGARGLLAIARLAEGHAAFLLEIRGPDARATGGADPILSRSS
jgi:predicted RNA methylase